MCASNCYRRLFQWAWMSTEYIWSDICLLISPSFPIMEVSKSLCATATSVNITGCKWNLLEGLVLSCWWKHPWLTAIDFSNGLNGLFVVSCPEKIDWIQWVGLSFSLEISMGDISVVELIILIHLVWSLWVSYCSVCLLNIIYSHDISRAKVFILLSNWFWSLDVIDILLVTNELWFFRL